MMQAKHSIWYTLSWARLTISDGGMAPLQEPHLGPNFLWIRKNNKLRKNESILMLHFCVCLRQKCWGNLTYLYHSNVIVSTTKDFNQGNLKVKHWAYNYELPNLTNFHYYDLSFCITNDVYDCYEIGKLMIALWRVKSSIHLDVECIFQTTPKFSLFIDLYII